VLQAGHSFPCLNYFPLEISGSGITAAPSEVICHPRHPVAVVGESCLGVRQQRRAYRPGRGRVGVGGDRVFDQSGYGTPQFPGQLGRHLIGGDGLDQPVHRHRPVSGWADTKTGSPVGARQRTLA
jgi:hypothetical protein